MKDIWIDLLTFNSAIKLIGLYIKHPIDKIYYINRCRYSSFIASLLKKLIKRPIVQVTDVAEGDEEIGGVSLCELIIKKCNEALQEWSEKEPAIEKAKTFCQRHNYNFTKFKEHLKREAHYHFIYLVKLQFISEKISNKNDILYLVRSSPIVKMATAFLDFKNISFYKTYLAHLAKIQNRPDYLYDPILNRKYYTDRFSFVVRHFLSWVSLLVNRVVFCLLLKRRQESVNSQKPHSNICVELIQGTTAADKPNDIYWLKNSSISPETVYGLEFREYDREARDELKKSGINLCKILRRPFQGFSAISERNLKERRYLTVDILNLLKAAKYVLRSFLYLLFWNKNNWVRCRQDGYAYRVLVWESLYRQMGVRLVWTLHYTEADKLVKAQALELLDGLLMSSHWGLYPTQDIRMEKCCDILFTWGQYFVKNVFNKYPYLDIFITGYISDHYFEELKPQAKLLRERYKGNFVLCYQDNIPSNDSLYGRKSNTQIYKMIISLIEKNSNIVVFLKPKSKDSLSRALRDLPDLKSYIDLERIAVFLKGGPNDRIVPAQIAMASDLVIGLGLSTAAAESYFAGTVSFHADLTRLTKNEFANQGLGKIVFREIEDLESVIQNYIDGRGDSYADYRRYYDMLDSFQDGQSYKRTGFVISQLQKAFEAGASRKEAIRIAREKYDSLVSNSNAEIGVPISVSS